MAFPLAVPLVALAASTGFHSAVTPVSQPVRKQVKAAGSWHQGCPVPFSQLRTLTVTHWDFNGRRRTGRLIVNARVTGQLTSVFRKLDALHFPIRHLSISSAYGPDSKRPKDTDISGSLECRQAVPSPCDGGTGTGSWSMHSYGLAVDINPVENPYVGCGQSRDPAAQRFRKRTPHRKGMVTRRAVAAFRSAGWGWGGAWTGNTKDYMHFSTSGH